MKIAPSLLVSKPERYVGLDGVTIGMTTFGASAPGDVAMDKFGFTVDNIVEKSLTLIGKM